MCLYVLFTYKGRLPYDTDTDVCLSCAYVKETNDVYVFCLCVCAVYIDIWADSLMIWI